MEPEVTSSTLPHPADVQTLESLPRWTGSGSSCVIYDAHQKRDTHGPLRSFSSNVWAPKAQLQILAYTDYVPVTRRAHAGCHNLGVMATIKHCAGCQSRLG